LEKGKKEIITPFRRKLEAGRTRKGKSSQDILRCPNTLFI